MNWPEPSPSTEIEEEEDGPITVVLKEDELEQPIRDLLRSIDETDKIDGVELERIVSVLLAAREMLFEEKRRTTRLDIIKSKISSKKHLEN